MSDSFSFSPASFVIPFHAYWIMGQSSSIKAPRQLIKQFIFFSIKEAMELDLKWFACCR